MSQARNMRANGTIRVKRFVKMDTADNNSVVEGTANARVIGISQAGGRTPPIPEVTTDPVEAAQAGENVGVHSLGAVCELEAGTGGWTAGDYLKSDSAGKGVALDGTLGLKENVGAYALETVSAGEFGEVQIVIFSETTDAT